MQPILRVANLHAKLLLIGSPEQTRACECRTELTCRRGGEPSKEAKEQQLIQDRLQQRHPVYSRRKGPSTVHLLDRYGRGRDSRILGATAIAATGPAGFCCCRAPRLELFTRLDLSADELILPRACKRAAAAKIPVPLGESYPTKLLDAPLSPPPAPAAVGPSFSCGSPLPSPELGGFY